MELTNKLLQEIHEYISGRMDKDQKELFELQIQQDPALAEEVKTQRELKEGLIFLSLKEKYRGIHQDLKKKGLLEPAQPLQAPLSEEPKTIPLPTTSATDSNNRQSTSFFVIFRPHLVAASFVVALGLGWYLWKTNADNKQNQQLYSELFSPAVKARPAISSETDILGSAQNTDAAKDSVAIAEAIAYLNQDKSSGAIAILQNLPKSKSYWHQVGEWYLALSYLKDNERSSAKTILENIVKTEGHIYQQEAEKLLRELE